MVRWARLKGFLNPEAASRRRKQVILCGIGLAILFGLFPPWRFVIDNRSMRISLPAGYAWSAPKCEDESCMKYGYPESRIDVGRLVLDWAIIALVTWGILVALKMDQAKGEQSRLTEPENKHLM